MKKLPTSRGPFRAEQLRPGDPYELSNGHAVRCLPTGGRGSKAEGAGYKVLSTDPGAQDVGIDTGFSPEPGSLRAPDLAAGTIPDAPGWVEGVPRLAVEYVDIGQDQDDLAGKIGELLEAGTEIIWVVHLTGPRRVEVHRAGEAVRIAHGGEELEAPGILKYPVLVESLYDEETSNKVALRNLLEKEEGYRSLDEVRVEGRVEGELEALKANLLAVFKARQFEVDEEVRTTVLQCNDLELLKRWNLAAITAPSARKALDA